MKLFLSFLLIIPGVSFAEVFGFNPLGNFGKVTPKSQIEVANLPPEMTQDTLGVCYSCVAAIMLTAENCKTLNQDCQKIAPENIFSVVGIAPFGRSEAETQKRSTEQLKKKSIGTDRSDGLPGGSLVNLLAYMKSGSGPSEKCLSLDQILSKIGGAKEPKEAQLDVWVMLKELYAKSKEIKPNCSTCQSEFYATAKSEIEEKFNITISNEAMLKAFSADTYSRFFDKLFIRTECKSIANAVVFEGQNLSLDYLPKGRARSTYKESIKKVKEILNKGRPLGLTNICLDQNATPVDKCALQHAVVISGYRQVCSSGGECKDSVKVVNCWGKTWQDQNDQGWVDAKVLIDRSLYQEGSLTWFEDKN